MTATARVGAYAINPSPTRADSAPFDPASSDRRFRAPALVALGLFLRDGLLLLCGAAIVGGALAIAYRLLG
jgi:hypothetical protein